jgi:hypothetical protein
MASNPQMNRQMNRQMNANGIVPPRDSILACSLRPNPSLYDRMKKMERAFVAAAKREQDAALNYASMVRKCAGQKRELQRPPVTRHLK